MCCGHKYLEISDSSKGSVWAWEKKNMGNKQRLLSVFVGDITWRKTGTRNVSRHFPNWKNGVKEKNIEKKYKKHDFLVEKVEKENEKKRRTRRGEMKELHLGEKVGSFSLRRIKPSTGTMTKGRQWKIFSQLQL